jgi:hypothetical protein
LISYDKRVGINRPQVDSGGGPDDIANTNGAGRGYNNIQGEPGIVFKSDRVCTSRPIGFKPADIIQLVGQDPGNLTKRIDVIDV